FTWITDELTESVSEKDRKSIPGFVRLLDRLWDGNLDVEEAARRMLLDDNQNLLVCLPSEYILQMETYDFFFRIKRLPYYVIIGLASIDRYIQITVYILKLKNNKISYYVYQSPDHVRSISKNTIATSILEDFDGEINHLRNMVEAKRKRLRWL